MGLQTASETARNVARHRAAHLLLDGDPKILIDTYARDLAGHRTDADLLATLAEVSRLPSFPRMRALFVVRQRFVEDELFRSMAWGIAQYVILGAGLDAFVFRHPDHAGSLHVFEVDHPASQNWKREQLANLGIPLPANLTFVSVDFETEALGHRLVSEGLDRSRLAFFSWMGVIQYLPIEAVRKTLREIARLTMPGSELVLQSIPPAETLALDEGSVVLAEAARAGRLGEPWQTFLETSALEELLAIEGFETVGHLSATAANERYLSGRSDGLNVPGYFRVTTARLR
jgi:methyltransferase (TIGR00027 family)